MAAPLLAFAAVSALSSMYSGYQRNKALSEEAELVTEQGLYQYEDALREAAITRKEGDIFAQKQSLQYIGAGFKLGGSALITIRDTKIKSEAEADAIELRGKRQYGLALKRSDQLRDQGRAAMISGILGAGKSIASVSGAGGGGGS